MNCLDSTREEPDKLRAAICLFLFMRWGGVRRGVPSLTWRVSILKTLTILGAPPKGGRQAQVWGSLSVQMKQPDSSIPWTLNKLVGPQKWAEQVTHPATLPGKAGIWGSSAHATHLLVSRKQSEQGWGETQSSPGHVLQHPHRGQSSHRGIKSNPSKL